MARQNADNMHTRFRKFLVHNLCHPILEEDTDEAVLLWRAYKDFSELKWNDDRTLLENPVYVQRKLVIFLN